jgi:nicotinamidase/pyrazinamidase
MNALILVDIQNDFMPTGSLPVPKGNDVIQIANALIPHFDIVIATQDWHPQNHKSFAAEHEGRSPGELIDLNGLTQVLWPTHCVQHTFGSEFASELHQSSINKVVQKGTNIDVDSYSGFADNGDRIQTELHDYLQKNGIKELHVMGLATDYCVKFTALDAIKRGYQTSLIVDGCRGVNLSAGDVDAAIIEMKDAGVILSKHQDYLSRNQS